MKTRNRRIPDEVTPKMAATQGYSDIMFLCGSHLSCRFSRKAPRTCLSAFNDENKNNSIGKMFWLTRQAAGLSGN